MKKLFALLVFIALSFSAFRVNGVDVEITLDKEGNVHVREVVDLFITTNVDITTYSGNLDKDDLASWAELIKSDDVKLHVDRRYVNVKNLKVRPQPLRNLDPVRERANGEIIIMYDAEPYFVNGSLVNGTGLFKQEVVKPRVIRYILNEKALSFRRTGGDSIILDEKTTLRFYLPSNSVIVDINPKPLNVDELTLPVYKTTVYWRGSILPKLTLVVEVKQGLDEEIRLFFENKIMSFLNYINSFEGKVVVTFIFIIIVFYIYLLRRVIKGGKK